MSPPRTVGMIAQTAAARQWPRQPENANSAPAANPMRNRYTPYICSEQIDVIENLLPRRWTADDIPMRADGNLIRQLMLQGEIRRNISAISRISRKFRPTVGMRIENHNLFTKLISYIRDIRHSQTEPTSCSYCKSPHGHAVRSAQGGYFQNPGITSHRPASIAATGKVYNRRDKIHS